MAERKKPTIIPDPIISLNDDYQVTLDSRCLILQKKASQDDKELSSEEKKSGIKNLGYYSTWEHLGTSLVKKISRDKAINKQDKLSIEEFTKIIQETNKEVSEMFKQIDDKSKIKKSK